MSDQVSPEIAIQTEQLTKHFLLPQPLGRMVRRPLFALRSSRNDQRTVIAVEDVSLTVRRGELFGLLGPNGAGKTTLIKLLCTLIQPSSGQAQVAGFDIRQESQVRQRIGLSTGDERSFYWRLSGRLNLEFFAALYGMDRAAASRRAAELLAQVGLNSHADRPFRTYSSGQKQRLSIARALLHQPEVLFLDEPTRSLDPTATLNLHTFIQEELLGRRGITIVLTTHRLDEAQRLADRIGIMDHGHLQATGAPEALRASLGASITYRLKVRGLTADPDSLNRDVPGQLRAEASDDGGWLLEMRSLDSEAALPALLRRIAAAGGQVVSVEREQSSLEQVFQHFTSNQP